MLDRHDETVRCYLQRYQGREVKSTGDGFSPCSTAPAARSGARRRSPMRSSALGLQVRAGVHTGEVKMSGQDVGGVAVHVGARIAALASLGEVLASRTVKDLAAGSGITFASRGTHELRGVPGRWELYAAA
jgi:class 3 adenylate cyclase